MDFDPDKVGGRQQMQKLTQDIAWRLCDNLHDSSLKYIRLFSENFFALVCSLHAGVPVLIEGPPGCSKTFTWNVVRRCFSGDVVDGIEASRIQQMVVQSITVQCSKQTTDTDVKRGFKELENLKKKSKEHNKDEHNSNIVCTIVLDEASLVDNEEAPLKTLHQQLDYCIISNEEQNNRPCVILSNNILDAAKTSRVILVAQSALDCDPSIDDPNPELMELIDDRFTEDEKRRIARVYGYANKFYAKYCSTDWNKYFYHLRDLVFFQRELADKLDNSKGGLLSDDNKERVFRILTRQFGGMPADAYSKLMEVLYPSGNFVPNPSMIYDEMKKQLINPETRYRNYLIIDDTESGIPLTLMKNLLGNKLRHCYVTDFSADTGDQIQQDAIKTVVSAMHGGQKVVITNIVPVSSAFFTLFNLETESNDGGEKRVVYANIAIGPVLYPYLLKEGFSIIVYMTRSELKNAPTALLNRFQKILFTGNGFVDYVECTLNLDKSVRSKISKCKRSCRQLVDSCGRKMFSGYSERNTVSTALINSLTDHGGFLCPQPYERLFASSTDAPEQNNITNTLHMLMLVARSNILHQSAFFLDDSLKRAFERLQQHNTVVRFIRFLKNNQHCPDVCWNVLTEKCMTLSYSRYTLQESLKKSLGSGSRIEVLSLSGEKRDDFDKAVSQAFEGCASFVVCLADMSLCSASNVNYARRLLEDKIEAKKRRPFVIFVQMFPSSQLYDIEKYCSAFFFPWRCTFIEKLFDDKHSESKGLEEKESSLITTMKCEGPLFDVWNSFDEKQKEVFSYDSVKNKRFCEEEKEEEKTLCECSLDDIYSFFLMKPQADRSQESVCLLDLLRETGSEQMTKRQTIRTICCEKEFIIHPRIDFAFGGWEKSDLCCMLKHWCLQSVEEENRFWNDFSPLYDVLAEIAKSKECESRNPARGRCLLGLHKKIQEQPQLKQLKQQELRDLLLEKASKDTVRLLDVIKDFAKYQSYYSVSLRVFCEERGFVTEDRVTNLLGGWTMDELYCLVVFWCQRHVHNEEKFFSRAERECSKCIDGLSEEQKRILGIVVEEFRSIMQSGLFLNGENDVILRLREAQKCCRIDDRINWELMFDDTVCSLKGVEEYLLPSVPPNDPSNFLYLNKVLFFPIRCCIFGLRHYKKYIQLKFSDMDDERKRRSYCSSEVSRNPVLSLIFMRPNFSCLLDTEEAENRVW